MLVIKPHVKALISQRQRSQDDHILLTCEFEHNTNAEFFTTGQSSQTK